MSFWRQGGEVRPIDVVAMNSLSSSTCDKGDDLSPEIDVELFGSMESVFIPCQSSPEPEKVIHSCVT